MSSVSETKLPEEPTVTPFDDPIYPEVEPAVINQEMIDNAYLEPGYEGEEAILHQLSPVIYDSIFELSLEYRNIIRIDHLWILPNLTKLSLNSNKIEVIENIEMLVNLKKLDLSFNYIEKIENLDALVNLEELSLFDNCISIIENLDNLENLVILSLGHNDITSVKGIERFRFLPRLSVLILEGNPIAQNNDWPLLPYIAAVLPNLKFLDYVTVSEDARIRGKERFVRELREIETTQEIENADREQRAKEIYDADRLAKGFVELLNEHQLFESLWVGDEDGRALMKVGLEAEMLRDEYAKDLYVITQDVYKFGLVAYEEREVEIQEFLKSLEEGQNEVQNIGHGIIEEFLKEKEQVFEDATAILKVLEQRTINGEEEDSPESLDLRDRFDRISLDFEDTISYVWSVLMGHELHLHEVTEESTLTFQRNLQELMSKFIEQINTFFSQLRDISAHFAEAMTDVVSHYVAQKLALQDFSDVPPELLHCMDDRDAVLNLIAGMKDAHIQRIDEREDRMIFRSKEFIEDMIAKLTEEELERNRYKILEVNSFLDMMSMALENLSTEIAEELMSEEQ